MSASSRSVELADLEKLELRLLKLRKNMLDYPANPSVAPAPAPDPVPEVI